MATVTSRSCRRGRPPSLRFLFLLLAAVAPATPCTTATARCDADALHSRAAGNVTTATTLTPSAPVRSTTGCARLAARATGALLEVAAVFVDRTVAQVQRLQTKRRWRLGG